MKRRSRISEYTVTLNVISRFTQITSSILKRCTLPARPRPPPAAPGAAAASRASHPPRGPAALPAHARSRPGDAASGAGAAGSRSPAAPLRRGARRGGELRGPARPSPGRSAAHARGAPQEFPLLFSPVAVAAP